MVNPNPNPNPNTNPTTNPNPNPNPTVRTAGYQPTKRTNPFL